MSEFLTEHVSDIAAAIEAGRRSTSPEIRKTDLPHAAPFVVLRGNDGSESVRIIDEQIETPHHIDSKITVLDVPSFKEYFVRYADEHSLIYGSLNPAQFVAILNEPAPDGMDWRDHRLTLRLEHAKEWDEWIGKDGHKFESMDSFAEWLEDQVPDIIAPSGAEFLEMALNMKVNEAVRFNESRRLSDGYVELGYSNWVEGQTSTVRGGTISIPERFTIKIPVFKGIKPTLHEMNARFRFRIPGGKLRIWYDLERPHKVIDEAFSQVWGEISEQTKRTILLGNPGSL